MLIYVITDRRLRPDLSLESMARQMARSGADMIQIREKDLLAGPIVECAAAALAAAGPSGPVVYVNGRPDAAVAASAAGVHLPAAGLPPDVVRARWGGSLRVAVSTHSMSEARQAASMGADLITFGPIFETDSKRGFGPPAGVELLKEVVASTRLPVFAIGGIGPRTIGMLEGIAVAGVAVISAVVAAPDMAAAVTELREAAGAMESR